MREDESNWFSKWEEELPSPEELMPLSQTLITPHLASAFDIRGPGGATPVSLFRHHHQPPQTQPNSSEFDSSSAELGGGGGVGSDEPARTLKRPRLVWTPQLHKRFVDAVAHLGIKNAVPKTIMQLMSVEGLTRENVASHLQKYRLYLKRMQGVNNGSGPGSMISGSGDSDTDRLFASQPVPAHFLHQATRGGNSGGGVRPNSDHFVSYMPVAALHHQQMAATVVGHQQIQGQYSQHLRQMGHFGSAQSGAQFDHPFLSRQAQLGPNRNALLQNNSGFVVDMESANNGRKVLTLFPTADE